MCIEYECSWMNMNVKIRALKNMAFFGCDILLEIEPFNHNQKMKLCNEKKIDCTIQMCFGVYFQQSLFVISQNFEI